MDAGPDAHDPCADPDRDGDGVASLECGGGDCDDSDPRRYPGALELCDYQGLDEDCDPDTFGAKDVDRDGAIDSRCCNGVGTPFERCGDDCDDVRASIRPTGAEICNGFDDDCSGSADEGVGLPFRPDRDRDLHGDELSPDVLSCPGIRGFALYGDDCDDDARNSFPGAAEIPDGEDNDCDGLIDEALGGIDFYPDRDGDGFGDGTATPIRSKHGRAGPLGALG